MSTRASTWAWEQRGLKHADRLALLILADIADADGVAYPSRRHLADVLECSRDTVDRRVKALVTAGLLTVEADFAGATKARRSNVYHLAIPADFARAEGGRKVAATPAEGGRKPAERVAADVRPGWPQHAAARVAATAAATIEPPYEPLAAAGVGASVREPAKPTWERIADAVGSPWLDPHKSLALAQCGAIVEGWLKAGADLDLDVIPTVRRLCASRRSAVASWNYFATAVREATAKRLAAEADIPAITAAEATHDHASSAPARRTSRRANEGGSFSDFMLRKCAEGEPIDYGRVESVAIG